MTREPIRYKDNSKILSCVKEQKKNCKEIAKILSGDKIEEILDNSTNYSHEAIDNLFTITSLIERDVCDRNTIEKYY